MPKRQPRQAKRQPEREAPTRTREQEPDGAEFPDVTEEPMQDWLVPIGNTGFYQSPVEPVDPRDCDRWPDSPYCDGSGVNLDNFIDLIPEVHVNDCEICVTISPTLAFISLPPYTICKRKNTPECIPQVPVAPPTYPVDDANGYQKRCADGSYAYIGTTTDNLIDGNFFPQGTDIATLWNYQFQKELAAQKDYWSPPPTGWSEVTFAPGPPNEPYNLSYAGMPGYALIKVKNGIKTFSPVPNGVIEVATPWRGEYSEFGVDKYFTASAGVTTHRIVDWVVPDCDPAPNLGPVGAPPYGPPGLPERDCCMNCAEQDRLLKLIAKRLGTDDYPASVPKSLLTDRGSGQQQIESLTQLIGWLVQQVDGLVGEFPIQIKIEDTDPTKPGNQSQDVKIPNIAEAIADLYALSLKNSVDSDASISFLMRLASEVIGVKNAALITQDYARANAEFLGYKGNNVKRDVSYAFDPEGLASLETILKESNKQIVGWQIDETDSLLDYQKRLMFAAGIIKAVFFRGKKDVPQLNREVNNLVNSNQDEDRDERWREFLRAINNPDHRFNVGDSPNPDIKDLSVPTDLSQLKVEEDKK